MFALALTLAALPVQGLPADLLPAAARRTSSAGVPDPGADDRTYAAAVARLAVAPDWPWDEIERLRAATAPRRRILAARIAGANAAELRLLAVLGAGSDGSLRDALLAVGAGCSDEAVAVACLLAPAAPPPDWWPALAHAAVRAEAGLTVRAAATARLLESGCSGAWPLARSILRSGTAGDEAAPWADWLRSGRYELPKRLVVAALDPILLAHDGAASGFEPNAAWETQERALAALEPRMRSALQQSAPPEGTDWSAWLALLRRTAGGDPACAEALRLLAPAAGPPFRQLQDPALRRCAESTLTEAPR